MSKGDFTRLTFRKEKHYRSVRRQQGRVDLDADWNEQADITSHRTETEARDVIGPCGAPKHDAGFAILAPGTGGDFKIGAGRFYVDGILCENEQPVLFSQQPDLPGTPPLPTQGRYLVYLDVWQRHLTALDDPEIREVALGGPDTATRIKTISQVRVVKVGNLGANVTCASEPPEWANIIKPSDGKLSARAEPDAQSDKPCIVPPGAGYRRLENQLYRVEIHDGGDLSGGTPPTFKWSRDNGSIAARVASITGNAITLTTSRKDSALGFAPGQWIEIIDAGQELQGKPGTMVQISAVDDLVLTVDLTHVIGTFPSTPLSNAAMALLPKVRRWDSVPGVMTASIPSTNNGFIPLEDGVEVKFNPGSYRTGDYWMIPARTDKGNVEWPQDSATPPNPLFQPKRGIVHHFCRLAIIECKGGNRAVTVVEDCRRLFPPLTELEDACGCCTKTVGDTGEADYRLIQEAVDSLPATGGQICVLAGTYAESVVISGKHNITIIGCRERTVLNPGLSTTGVEIGPIIQIKDNCTNIRLESLSFREGLRSAVVVLDSSHVTICECEIVMTKSNGSEPAIFFHGDDGLIERNVIAGAEPKTLPHSEVFDQDTLASAARALPSFTASAIAASATQSAAASATTTTAHPASGIQLAGGCHRVRVLDNLISRVPGQAITLGDLEQVPLPTSPSGVTTTPGNLQSRMIVGRWTNPDDRCDECNGITNEVPFQKIPQKTYQLISPESLWDIYIERNRIYYAGLDGIGVIGFFDLSEQDEFVTVRGLTILGNEITDCLSVPPKPIAAALVDSMGYGGIALADVSELVIYDNVIERNGAGHSQPVCGIFVLHGQGIDIERNRIIGNGYQPQKLPPQTTKAAPSPGREGGIQIIYALAPVAPGASVGTVGPAGVVEWSPPLSEATGFPALKIHDNIVSAPVGPALSAVALGPVSVVGNQLTSGRLVEPSRSFVFAPATVFVFNLGISNEIYTQQNLFADLGTQSPPPVSGLDDLHVGRLVDGNVLFANNQCSLDLLEPGKSPVFTSLVLASFDDIGFLNNQCDCNLGAGEDTVVAHACLLSPSLRVIGNRFKEGVFSAAYSAITTGTLNITAHNQATHCLQINGSSGLTLAGPNIILMSGQCQPRLEDTWNNLIAIRNQS